VQAISEQVNKTGSLSPTDNGKLKLLKPQLAYIAYRKKDVPEMDRLQYRLAELINDIQNDTEKFKRFYYFLQSILAYHKYYGG